MCAILMLFYLHSFVRWVGYRLVNASFVVCVFQALRTQLLARHPVNYLNQCLRSKHPRLICQTPTEVRD